MRSLNEHKELNEKLSGPDIIWLSLGSMYLGYEGIKKLKKYLKDSRAKKYEDTDEFRLEETKKLLDKIGVRKKQNDISDKIFSDNLKKSKSEVLSDVKNRKKSTVPSEYYKNDPKGQYKQFISKISSLFYLKQRRPLITYLNKNPNTKLTKNLLDYIETNYGIVSLDWKYTSYLFDRKLHEYLEKNDMPTYKELISILDLEKKYLKPATFNPY